MRKLTQEELDDLSRKRKVSKETYRKSAKGRAKWKVYYEANKEKIIASTKVWRAVNKEKHKAYRETTKEEAKAYNKIWFQANKEKIKVRNKAWWRQNPKKVRASQVRRRAKKAGVINRPVRDNFLDYLKEVWGNKCAYCKNASEIWHKDHFMPLELKGHEAEYNYVLACPSCNCTKSDKHPFLFIKEQKICFVFKPYMRFI